MSINFPNQFNPSVYGTRRGWLGPVVVEPFSADFVSPHREWIGLGLNACRALGMEIIYVAHEEDSDFSVRRIPDFAASTVPARTSVEKQMIVLDPSLLGGEDVWVHAVAHEFMSLYGCLHIRHDASEVGRLDSEGNLFSPFGPSLSLMNQFLPVDPEITADSTGFQRLLRTPSADDIREFNRVWRPEMRR